MSIVHSSASNVQMPAVSPNRRLKRRQGTCENEPEAATCRACETALVPGTEATRSRWRQDRESPAVLSAIQTALLIALWFAGIVLGGALFAWLISLCIRAVRG